MTTVWTAHWYVSGEPIDGRKVQVPTLKARHTEGRVWEVESNADKSRVLQETFFLKPPWTTCKMMMTMMQTTPS